MAAFLGALLAACSTAPKILPRNELNEPVMHQTHYTAIGFGAMPELLHTDLQYSDPQAGYYQESGSFGFEFHALPRLAYERSVAPWASFSILPVYWNLLLTGDQYAASASLKTGKLHAAFHGGPTGIHHVEGEGWRLTGEVELSGKYLASQRWYYAPTAGVAWSNHTEIGEQQRYAQVVAGWQLREEHSFSFGGRFTAFAAPSGEISLSRARLGTEELNVEDGDYWTSLWVGNTNYLGPRHVFGTELGFTWREGDNEATQGYRIGAWYRFVFE